MWILHLEHDYYICSACGSEAYWDPDYGQQLFDYCPYCGEYNRIGLWFGDAFREKRKRRTIYDTNQRNTVRTADRRP